MNRIPRSRHHRAPSISQVEQRAAQRAKNADALRRILAWMGKDKGIPELAAFLGCTYSRIGQDMQRLSDGTDSKMGFTDLIIDKLPLAPTP